MRIMWTIGVLFLVLTMLAACAPGPNSLARTPDEDGKVAGFWQGLWQGIISPITFIISLFTATVQFYEVHNNGNWYNLGFVLGAGILTGGGLFGSRRKRHE
jgi:LPXTG-motif cell wall-anchored protein